MAVAGEVDVATAPLLEEFLDAVDGDVVIDLTDVGFLDSSGIATLVRTRLRADRAGATLTLHNPQVPVRRVLEITGLDDWIEQC